MPQIISEDTTWTSGQTINLSDDLQIAPGVTLTIEDGVVVNGFGKTIEVFGEIIALDEFEDDIIFNDAIVFPRGGVIDFTDITYYRGQFSPTGSAPPRGGNFTVKGSEFYTHISQVRR